MSDTEEYDDGYGESDFFEFKNNFCNQIQIVHMPQGYDAMITGTVVVGDIYFNPVDQKWETVSESCEGLNIDGKILYGRYVRRGRRLARLLMGSASLYVNFTLELFKGILSVFRVRRLK